MYKNHEGYKDITAGKAIERVIKSKESAQKLRYKIGQTETLKTFRKEWKKNKLT